MQKIFSQLESVQEVDLAIDKLKKSLGEMPHRFKQLDLDIAVLQRKVSEYQVQITALDKNLRQVRGAIELGEDRTKRAQDRLGLVKNSDEFQALQKEFDSLKRSGIQLREQESALAQEMDKLQSVSKTVEDSLNVVVSKKEHELTQVRNDSGGIESELQKLEDKRQGLVKDVPAKYLNAYAKARQSKGGSGIALASGGICRGCHMQISPQIYVEVQKQQEIHICPSCRRLLIYKENHQ